MIKGHLRFDTLPVFKWKKWLTSPQPPVCRSLGPLSGKDIEGYNVSLLQIGFVFGQFMCIYALLEYLKGQSSSIVPRLLLV